MKKFIIKNKKISWDELHEKLLNELSKPPLGLYFDEIIIYNCDIRNTKNYPVYGRTLIEGKEYHFVTGILALNSIFAWNHIFSKGYNKYSFRNAIKKIFYFKNE